MADAASDTAMVAAKVGRLVARCTELRAYIANNTDALIDYGQRHRAGKPVSSSRAESTVNQLVNARMNKRRQMRWSPQGAHRVLQVMAAILDNRLGQQTIQIAA
jgi:UDP-N-acetylmuramate-alanine ligase